jgi:hypothetical protein
MVPELICFLRHFDLSMLQVGAVAIPSNKDAWFVHTYLFAVGFSDSFQ